MGLFEWMHEHWFTSFCAIMMILTTLHSLVKGVFYIPFRHMNIRKHGWPPEHCDADGDFKESD